MSCSPRTRDLSPSACSSCSCFSIPWSAQSVLMAEKVSSREFCFRKASRISSPRFCVSLPSRRSIAWIFVLALAVDTKFIHDGSTCCEFDVSISTWSPLLSLWLSGTSLWFTLAPMQWLPRKVCIWKAKSRAVHPAGIVLISPFGVNTNISDAKRFSFMVSRKSMASGCGSSRISFMVRSQLFSSPSSSENSPFVATPSLYFQWAANPCSASSSMRSERICTSIHFPCLLIRVTWRA